MSSAILIILRAICICVLFGILAAGLWPFHAPRNDVHWSDRGSDTESDRGGLVFGKHGSIVSERSFEPLSSDAESSCTVEIWLQPERSNSSGTILEFYRPATQAIPFSLHQSLSDLVLVRNGQNHLAKRNRIYIDEAFKSVKPVFITITSSKSATLIYLDGKLTKRVASFEFSGSDLTGELVIANAANTNNSWSGQLNKLAIYGRELLPVEILQHFHEKAEDRGNKNASDVGDVDLIADYRFDEGRGSVARSAVTSSPSLLIPERFFVLHQPFLERPWDEFRPDWNYWQDVAVNIFGFIPFGFFFRAYFFLIRKVQRATWLTVTFGFAISLTIEVSQAFMPTRDSGMTDLINNTLGTALGALLCAWVMKRDWFRLVGFTTA